MPKKVDHTERRSLIADALLTVAADQGLEAVSLRHVAAAAGVSSGMVQHYFRTKDEMMRFAMDVVRERTEARITAALDRLGTEPEPRVLLRTMITGILPLDEESRAYGRVGLAFLAYTTVRPDAAAPLRAETRRLREHVAALIRTAAPAADPETAAITLLAAMEGLGVYLLGGHCTGAEAARAVDAQLDAVFGPSVPARGRRPPGHRAPGHS